MGDFDTTVLENATVDDLILACDTLPMLNERRLVLDMDDPMITGRKDVHPDVTKYISDMPDTAVLIFYCHGKTDSRRSLVKTLARMNRQVTFNPLREKELLEWIMQTFRACGKTCSSEAAMELTFVSGEDTAALRGEIGKISAFTGSREEISLQDIHAMATPSGSYRVWELTDRVVAGEATRAFGLLRDMHAGGESDFLVIYMLTRQYRNMLALMDMAGSGREEILAKTGIQPQVLGRMQALVKQYERGQVLSSLEMCIDTEYQMKSGQMVQTGAAENLILRLLALRKGVSS